MQLNKKVSIINACYLIYLYLVNKILKNNYNIVASENKLLEY